MYVCVCVCRCVCVCICMHVSVCGCGGVCYFTFKDSWQSMTQHREKFMRTILPYFGKRKQVTYHPNLSYWCFHYSHNELFFHAKFHAETLILLRDMLGKTSWYSIDVSVNDRHILLFYKKCHFCHLLPFAKVGQNCPWRSHNQLMSYLVMPSRMRSNTGTELFSEVQLDGGVYLLIQAYSQLFTGGCLFHWSPPPPSHTRKLLECLH